MVQDTSTTESLVERPIRTALLGWSEAVMAACHDAGRDFVAVVPPAFAPALEEQGIPTVAWDFGLINEESFKLYDELAARGVEVAVPLYEETVEWAGILNSRFRDDPRSFNRAMLFRNKAMMKRKAQMHGLRVGIFEEVDTREDVRRFFERVNEANLKLEGEEPAPIHVKPYSAAGTIGHHFIRSIEDIDQIPDRDFPMLAESHLEGQEFSCEAWIHQGQLKFLNITEYVHLGHSNFIPASPSLEKHRSAIEHEIGKLIEAFQFRNGVIHPEFFVDADGTIKFGEVANRIPGGNIFTLIERAYGFSPFLATVLCADPETPEAELDALFPEPVNGASGIAGCTMIYPPEGKSISRLDIPPELEQEPYFERHDLAPPLPGKVPDREGFGGFSGTLYFWGDDPDRMRQLLLDWEEVDFYV